MALVLVLLISGRRLRSSQRQAQTDPVTGLLSGYGMKKRSEKILSDRQYAVVIVQLRNYRQLKQTFGRENSDRTLKYLGKVLRAGLAASEPIARLSGGSFGMLVKNRDENAIRARMMRLYENANQFNQTAPIPYALDLYFRVYIPQDDGETIQEMLERLVELPEESNQRCSFLRPVADTASRKWELVQQMEKSLESGDFLVFLQPKVRLSDNCIAGAEALIRWRHPQRGMLTPDMFLPVLEEYHLLPRYDLYLFEKVCYLQEYTVRHGMAPCPVSVNLSLETARQKDFMAPYRRIAEKYHVPPELVEFELSVSLQQLDVRELNDIVEQIHACNFRCALDKIGSDAIALDVLREVTVDTIKLDPRLLSAENNNRRNRFLLEAIIKFASQMQIRTIAEGINNVSQVQYLKQAGCDLIQGYYYFQPMSAEEFRTAAYHRGQLRYVEEESGSRPARELFAPTRSTTSGSIIMMSLLTSTDRVTFSSLFSPVLEQQYTVTNAAAFFQRSDLIHENDRKDFSDLLERCMKENGWATNTIRFYTAKGRYEWLEVHLHKEYIPAVGETVISGTMVNVAGWKNEVNRWKEKANRDALTGLYNREYFEQFASSAVETGAAAEAAVVFVDIDDFKRVNDTMGHVVGDEVICWFAKRILGAFRQSDIVARYGGDEFVVFVNGIDRRELSRRLAHLCEGFRTPYRNDSIEYHVSGSIGAAMFPSDGASYLDLLDRADSALYEAKRQGKNCFVLYRPGLEQAPQR